MPCSEPRCPSLRPAARSAPAAPIQAPQGPTASPTLACSAWGKEITRGPLPRRPVRQPASATSGPFPARPRRCRRRGGHGANPNSGPGRGAGPRESRPPPPTHTAHQESQPPPPPAALTERGGLQAAAPHPALLGSKVNAGWAGWGEAVGSAGRGPGRRRAPPVIQPRGRALGCARCAASARGVSYAV